MWVGIELSSFMVRAAGAAFSQTEVWTEAIVPFLSCPSAGAGQAISESPPRVEAGGQWSQPDIAADWPG